MSKVKFKPFSYKLRKCWRKLANTWCRYVVYFKNIQKYHSHLSTPSTTKSPGPDGGSRACSADCWDRRIWWLQPFCHFQLGPVQVWEVYFSASPMLTWRYMQQDAPLLTPMYRSVTESNSTLHKCQVTVCEAAICMWAKSNTGGLCKSITRLGGLGSLSCVEAWQAQAHSATYSQPVTTALI